jgi:hypothetical protein
VEVLAALAVMVAVVMQAIVAVAGVEPHTFIMELHCLWSQAAVLDLVRDKVLVDGPTARMVLMLDQVEQQQPEEPKRPGEPEVSVDSMVVDLAVQTGDFYRAAKVQAVMLAVAAAVTGAVAAVWEIVETVLEHQVVVDQATLILVL